MSLDNIIIPGKTDLEPIRRAIKNGFRERDFTKTKIPTDLQINELAKQYYKIHGWEVNEETIKIVVDAYGFGYDSGYNMGHFMGGFEEAQDY